MSVRTNVQVSLDTAAAHKNRTDEVLHQLFKVLVICLVCFSACTIMRVAHSVITSELSLILNLVVFIEQCQPDD